MLYCFDAKNKKTVRVKITEQRDKNIDIKQISTIIIMVWKNISLRLQFIT